MSPYNLSGPANGSNDVVSHSAATTPPVSEPTSNSVAQSPKPPRSDLDLVALSDVAPEPVKWLWPGRIPYGKVTILEGDPGLGKSQLTLDLVARVTAGEALPTGESVVQGNVVLLTAEDGLADTVRPRLDAAGGEAGRVHVLQDVSDPDGTKRLAALPHDVGRLHAAIKETAARLIVIDPLMAYLGDNINSWKDSDVRRALTPLARLAEDTGTAVVVIMHLNKGENRPAMYRGGGSIAFAATARSVLVVAPDPQHEELRVLSAIKSNLGPKPSSLSYRIAAVGSTSRVEWQGASPYDAETLLAEQTRSGDSKLKVEDAKEFLRDALRTCRRSKEEVLAEGVTAGHRARTLERAFETLGGISTKSFGGTAHWELPPRFAKSSHTKPAGENAETATQPSSGEDACAAESMVEACEEVLS